MEPRDDSRLALDPALMRQLGYRTVDMLVDRIAGPPGPVVRSATPEELHNRLAIAPPEDPVAFDEILEGLERDVLPYVARISHPGYLAFIPGEGTWPGALGDLIASALNVDTCWWLGASGPSALELVELDWFRQWIGYPEGAAGVLVSGGSASNLTALACAREARIGAMDEQAAVYMSDQTHSSLARAARALGFRPDQVRIIPTDERARPPGRPPQRNCRRPGRQPKTTDRRRERRYDGGRRDRPVSRAGRDLPRVPDLAPRGRRIRCVCLPQRARPPGARRDGARRLHHARPPQVALPADRGWRADGARRLGPPPGIRDLARLPHGRRSRRPGGELLRPRPAAHPQLPGPQAVDLSAVLWRPGIPRRDRQLARPRAPRAGRDRRFLRSGADVARLTRCRHLPAPSEWSRRRGGSRGDQRKSRRGD